ncbi:TetR/AcrR family transcriptional regulator [Actinocorallia sp. API 0066]|uniref:TetR/AcrR family transcriptional regulator n=1 Tax=Actinocorallia sp. API 0066 TaxID=2896846 RepID=UPI001E5BC97B|nr:TetR/AcrR family transcriptional regulator [Actinocorallia sp. API 0066]MCD0449300.1 TetR/AcrR family transcriptional regulator [Actinocorallia sp. API 0066]
MKDYRGLTAEQRRAERRRQLLDAGLRLFGGQGYAATSVRAVLRESGLNERYFAESFASLDALLAAVHDEIHAEMFFAAARSLELDAPPIVQIRHALVEMARFLEAEPLKARVKLVEVVGAGPLSQASRQRGLRAFAGLLATAFPQPAPDSPFQPRVLATGLVAAVNELFAAWIDGGLTLGRDELVDHAVVLVKATADRLTDLNASH